MQKLFFTLLLFIGLQNYSQVKTEEILIKNGEVELPGTLSYTQENQPLIIWVTGSGNIDRNGNQQPMVKANYIKQFRDTINSENIALFSYDKRTANKKNLKFLEQTTFNDLVADVKSVVNHFKNDKRFNSIILVGHSQGSLTAMLASENADKFISIAGAGEPVDKLLVKQISRQNPMLGNPTKLHCEELKKTGAIKQVHPMLLGLFNKKIQPFMASWMKYNPAKEIAKVKIPIAIIQGKKDLQVDVKDAKILYKRNLNSRLSLINNMNHMLKTIKSDDNNLEKEKKDNINSYIVADYPISKELIKEVKDFIFTDKKEENKVIILGE